MNAKEFLEKTSDLSARARHLAFVRELEADGHFVQGTGFKAPAQYSVTINGNEIQYLPSNDESMAAAVKQANKLIPKKRKKAEPKHAPEHEQEQEQELLAEAGDE